jgi:hypothetical protein
MQTNLEEDNLDLYTSYFGGPGSSQNYKLQLKQDYAKRFKLGSTIEVQRNRKVVITKGNPEDRKRTRPNQLSGVKRKSKFSDVIPNTANDITNKPVIVNSAIQIINKAVTINSAIIQQTDEYIGFVPPEYQTQDYGHLDNFNSALYQPQQTQPKSFTESEHYQQVWNEYKTSVGSGPQYSSHSTYLQQNYKMPSYPPPPYAPQHTPPPTYPNINPYAYNQPPGMPPPPPAQYWASREPNVRYFHGPT